MLFSRIRNRIASIASKPSSEIGVFNVVANSTAVILYFFPFLVYHYLNSSLHFLQLAIVGMPGLLYIPLGMLFSLLGLLRVLFEIAQRFLRGQRMMSNPVQGLALNLLALSVLLLWRMVLYQVPSWLYSY